MFVTANAMATIANKRRSGTLKRLIHELVLEANRLQIDEEELIDMLKAAGREEEKDERA